MRMPGHGLPIRSRFTLLYGIVFVLSGAVLLTIAGTVAAGYRVSDTAPGGEDTPATADALRQVQQQLAEVQDAQTRRVLLGSALALAVMAAASMLVGSVLARRVLRPLRTITESTRRITADDLDRRLAVPGPADEVKDLADTIDGLLERLAAAFAAQRRFVADASHELRTPMATMRALVDVAAAKPQAAPQTVALADRVRTELDRADRLLEGLLALARAQHGALADGVPVALADVVSAAVADRTGEAAARGLTVRVASAHGVRVRGDATLLRRLVDNLLDNAVRHNEPGGWIRVALAADGPATTLTVENGGTVLDPAQVAGLTAPFRRLGADRTGSDGGSGLGLAIVAAVAGAHGGTVALHARADGGLRASVVLPGEGS
ncbi:sensor histidine kinase [Actinocatenispora rupis]|uniref:histidine kinase n=1 Tax=Actinocatenispora rupis TaxID=519421 RepID=A0A8J3NG99_9ACTN|nr:HAMP domain-containing sensor histidine kinase [Actinocatenispora rupis]GID15725.1 two-component sensor histidine kinase [Actinocatenispora rupis]